LREGRLDEDLVAAHAVDVLDVDRTLLQAGTAVRARPEHLGVDHPVLLFRSH
jgi:cytosine/adenosine deaminase-related metal-dependent hydrolase